MSLKSILHDIGQFFSNLFKKLQPDVKKAVAVAVDVVNAIKTFDTGAPFLGDLIAKLIPGEVDDKILAQIRLRLPQILIELKLVEATADLTDPDEIVLAGIKVIQQLDGDYKSSFLHSLASLLTIVAADGKIDWADAVTVVQWFYSHKDNPEVDTTV